MESLKDAVREHLKNKPSVYVTVAMAFKAMKHGAEIKQELVVAKLKTLETSGEIDKLSA